MRKFEAHITCPREWTPTVEKAGFMSEWAFSAIDGDPVMGKQAYCYLTGYDTNAATLLERTNRLADFLRAAGVPVLREKVEEIIYDTKTGHDRMEACCGHCGEP